MVDLLSWDVGIKNLAGCKLSINTDKDSLVPYNITWWDIVNLLDVKIPICSCKNSIGLPCENPAKISAKLFDNQVYYCGIHKKQYKKIVEKCKCQPIKPINKQDFCHVCNSKVAKFFCESDNQKFNFCTEDKNIFCKNMKSTVIKEITTKDVNIDELKYNLWVKLDKIPHLLDVDCVIIENQPTLKNPKMKSIAETLYNYFLCRGIIDKIKTNSKIKKVKYICPSNKLKINSDNTVSVLSKASKSKDIYKLTKELAIKYCYQLIDKSPQLKSHLDSFKKKDDLCDAMLQGVYYLNK